MELDFDDTLDNLKKSINTYQNTPNERYRDICLSAMNAHSVIELAVTMYYGVFIGERRKRALALMLQAVNIIPNYHQEHSEVEKYYNKTIQLCEYTDFIEHYREVLGKAIEYTFAQELIAFVKHFLRIKAEAT